MKNAAMSKEQTAVSALAGADKKPDMKDLKAREITIRRGHKGGFIAKHRLEDKQGNHHYGVEPEFPLMDMKALHEHMQEHMGEPDQDDTAGQ